MSSLPFEVIGHVLSFVTDSITFGKCLCLSKGLLEFIRTEQAETVASSVTFKNQDSIFFTRRRNFPHSYNLLPLTYVKRLVFPFRIEVNSRTDLSIQKAFPNLNFLEIVDGCGGQFCTSIFKNLSAIPLEHLLIWRRTWSSDLNQDELQGMLLPFPSTIRSLSLSGFTDLEIDENFLPPKLTKLHLFESKLPSFSSVDTVPSPSWRKFLTHLIFELTHLPSISEFLGLFPNLEVLILRETGDVSVAFLGPLRKAWKLRKIHVRKCFGIASKEELIDAIGGQERVGFADMDIEFVAVRMLRGEMAVQRPKRLPELEWVGSSREVQ